MTEYAVTPSAIEEWYTTRNRTVEWVHTSLPESFYPPSRTPSSGHSEWDGNGWEPSDCESSSSLPPTMMLQYSPSRHKMIVPEKKEKSSARQSSNTSSDGTQHKRTRSRSQSQPRSQSQSQSQSHEHLRHDVPPLPQSHSQSQPRNSSSQSSHHRPPRYEGDGMGRPSYSRANTSTGKRGSSVSAQRSTTTVVAVAAAEPLPASRTGSSAESAALVLTGHTQRSRTQSQPKSATSMSAPELADVPLPSQHHASTPPNQSQPQIHQAIPPSEPAQPQIQRSTSRPQDLSTPIQPAAISMPQSRSMSRALTMTTQGPEPIIVRPPALSTSMTTSNSQSSQPHSPVSPGSYSSQPTRAAKARTHSRSHSNSQPVTPQLPTPSQRLSHSRSHSYTSFAPQMNDQGTTEAVLPPPSVDSRLTYVTVPVGGTRAITQHMGEVHVQEQSRPRDDETGFVFTDPESLQHVGATALLDVTDILTPTLQQQRQLPNPPHSVDMAGIGAGMHGFTHGTQTPTQSIRTIIHAHTSPTQQVPPDLPGYGPIPESSTGDTGRPGSPRVLYSHSHPPTSPPKSYRRSTAQHSSSGQVSEAALHHSTRTQSTHSQNTSSSAGMNPPSIVYAPARHGRATHFKPPQMFYSPNSGAAFIPVPPSPGTGHSQNLGSTRTGSTGLGPRNSHPHPHPHPHPDQTVSVQSHSRQLHPHASPGMPSPLGPRKKQSVHERNHSTSKSRDNKRDNIQADDNSHPPTQAYSISTATPAILVTSSSPLPMNANMDDAGATPYPTPPGSEQLQPPVHTSTHSSRPRQLPLTQQLTQSHPSLPLITPLASPEVHVKGGARPHTSSGTGGGFMSRLLRNGSKLRNSTDVSVPADKQVSSPQSSTQNGEREHDSMQNLSTRGRRRHEQKRHHKHTRSSSVDSMASRSSASTYYVIAKEGQKIRVVRTDGRAATTTTAIQPPHVSPRSRNKTVSSPSESGTWLRSLTPRFLRFSNKTSTDTSNGRYESLRGRKLTRRNSATSPTTFKKIS